MSRTGQNAQFAECTSGVERQAHIVVTHEPPTAGSDSLLQRTEFALAWRNARKCAPCEGSCLATDDPIAPTRPVGGGIRIDTGRTPAAPAMAFGIGRSLALDARADNTAPTRSGLQKLGSTLSAA
jgi:hypothetical protein